MAEPRDIYFEITRVGATAKVAAIDGASGVEVCVFGPAQASERELKRLAIAKLRARLARTPGRGHLKMTSDRYI